MAYIGREPQIGNFQVCDAISVVNGQAAYTMQVSSVNVSPETANHMLVSLNGVLQAPGSSYTVSGSTITFASNLVTGDVINFIHILGSVLDLGVPSDSTVSLAKLTATGTKNSTTFLRGDNTFAAPAAAGASDGFHALDMSGTASGDLVFITELFDDGGNYNVSNGRYTAPSDGKYLFNASVYPAANSTYVEHFFKKNGSNLTGGTDNFMRGYNTDFGIHISLIIDLSANDYINSSVDNNVYSNFCYFNGVKLY